MDSDRFRALDEELDRVLDQPTGEREAFLEHELQGRPETRAELERLLAADQQAGRFLERPLGATEDPASTPEEELRLGPYVVEKEIGRGGMGAVFLARRDDGRLERQVAIKILHGARFSPEGRARFQVEGQILARLEHPLIARLYDSGEAEADQPYLVMEYVPGEPLDRYCDRRQLPIAARLALFGKALGAVAYAHQNLLVHRDLKPSNILVSEAGEPKLIDFGIAKQLGPDGAETGDSTFTVARAMTPNYASPEQIRGAPVSTASDIYSLGVMLHQLLCGELPYRVESSLPHELEAAVLEQEPDGPSRMLASGSEASREQRCKDRGTSYRQLKRQLSGDLDTVVAKALAKDPARRYRTVPELAADLEHHLLGLPVTARPDTLTYRLNKFVGRHRWAMAASVIVLAVVLALFVNTLRERGRASLERDRAAQALEFLVTSFGEIDPYQSTGEDNTALAVLEQGVKRLEEGAVEDPQVKAALLESLSRIYESLRQLDRSAVLVEQAVELRRATNGPNSLELVNAMERLARIRLNQGSYEESETLLEEVVANKRRLLSGKSPGLARAVSLLAVAKAQRAGESAPTEIDALLKEAVEICRSCSGADRAIAGRAQISRADLAVDRGALSEAEALYREGLEMMELALGREDPEVLLNAGGFARIQLRQGKAADAEGFLRPALDSLREVLGDGHTDLGVLHIHLGTALMHQGRSSAAEENFRAALSIFEKTLGAEHPFAGIVQGYVANTLFFQGRALQALPLARQAMEARRRGFGDADFRVGQALLLLAAIERELGNLGAAGRYAREAEEIVEQILPENPLLVALSLSEGASLLLAVGDPEAAEPLLRRALALRSQEQLPEHFERLRVEVALGECLLKLSQSAEATQLLSGAVSLLKRLHPPESLLRQEAEKALKGSQA